MKLTLLALFLLVTINLFAENNATKSSDAVITIKDTSGLSKEALQDLAAKEDKKTQDSLVTETMINNISTPKKEAVWEKLAPTPKRYDWIELKSGEWLKGKFKALYSKTLEFDSDKLKLLSFDFKDVYQIRSHNIMTVSIQTQEDQNGGFFDIKGTILHVTGIIRVDRKTIRIIQGSATLEFPRDQIISIAYEGTSELQHWSAKVSLSVNANSGNTNQLDYTANAVIQRRTSKSKLRLDYLGNISIRDDLESANNHRFNETFNLYMTRAFFISPVTSEYFRDPYQNIHAQWTVGTGLGYTVIDTKDIDWSLSLGPAFVRSEYETVETDADAENNSWAVQLTTVAEIALTDDIDLNLNYQFSKLDDTNGKYRHHTITKLENEITSWLDFDITFIWDYLEEPTAKEDGTLPYKNDTQLLLGLGIDF